MGPPHDDPSHHERTLLPVRERRKEMFYLASERSYHGATSRIFRILFQALMAVLWLVLNILIFFMFTELEHIVDKYHLQKEITTDYTTLPHDSEPNLHSDTSVPSSSSHVLHTDSSTHLLHSDSSTHVLANSYGTHFLSSVSDAQVLPNSSLTDASKCASNTHALPNSSPSSQVVPNSSSTQVVPNSSSTQVLPNSSSTQVIPNSSSTQVVPNSTSIQVLPNSSSTKILSQSVPAETLPTQSFVDSISATGNNSVFTEIQLHTNSSDSSNLEPKAIRCNRKSEDQDVPEICNSVEYASLLMESAEKYLTSDSSGQRRSSSASDIIEIVDNYYSVEKHEYQSFPCCDGVDGSVEKSRDRQDKKKMVVWSSTFFCNGKFK